MVRVSRSFRAVALALLFVLFVFFLLVTLLPSSKDFQSEGHHSETRESDAKVGQRYKENHILSAALNEEKIRKSRPNVHPDETVEKVGAEGLGRSRTKESLAKQRLNYAEKAAAADTETPPVLVNYNVHVFYYPWYGTPEIDKKWLHWNHRFLPSWNKRDAQKYPEGRHEPPDDIGANFYPQSGPYSSKDPVVVDRHMAEIQEAGIGVVVVSWYPPGNADDEGQAWDSLMPAILDAAEKYRLKVTFHIEPFKNRDERSLFRVINYLITRYGSHPAFYRKLQKRRANWSEGQNLKLLPVLYFYDSYQLPVETWQKVLLPGGANSIRHSPSDAIVLGLLVERQHMEAIETGGFDGLYTYFASDGFVYGSTTRNWGSISRFCRERGLLFSPSVGPGYIDTEVRPWNGRNTKGRQSGSYYQHMFRAAINQKTDVISITSYNEWHEGTQIEPAVSHIRKPQKAGSNGYINYKNDDPKLYLSLTKSLVEQFQNEN